ncbi:phosphodiester glycosidase family protein [Paenibacillus sp. KQZ6P-2]|uniref:Phosphodiester glycosidase family protein n=1 Tax=Paenibacillus mangrovi TaxID=2931978 RepID=A0A9X1WTZ1_9BACL|nr:phosphodiester glycosidase family protein [Paenibacillus mangrovi]MCJ8014636.1 phosphodiester glycosidase family protein [Paenibacillus mangrovi]
MIGKRTKKIWSSVLSSAVILSMLLPAQQPVLAEKASTAAATGSVIDERQVEIGPGATYTWRNMKLDRGLEKLNMVEFDPKNPALSLEPGMTNGKVNGMQGVSKMASDADHEGNRVIAGINGDFYDMSTGVPLGLFMGNGTILTSPPDDWYAFGIKEDGTTLYGPSPKLTRTLTIGGKTSELSSINRTRGTNDLVLYTPDFDVSTMTNDLGDEVVLDVVQGEVKSGQTLQLKVERIHNDKGNTSIDQGKVVLSASGNQRNVLSGLKVGDDVTLSLNLEGAWSDVTMAIGGSTLLVKDGVAQPNGDPAAHPRTAVGTKADGSVVLLEIDGRQPGFSEGVTLAELGQIMQDMGVVNAINLDGGGSSTFIARMPGETERKLMNSPSDGGERKTANGLMLVNKAPEGAVDKLVVQPEMQRVLTGSMVSFKANAVDANLHPAAFNGTLQWSVDPQFGIIDDQGKFTAGATAGMTDISVTSGALSGNAKIEIVDTLTELSFGDQVKSIAPGKSETMKVTALRDGQVIQADNSQLQWSVEGPIGTIDSNGVFTATNETEQSGKIIVSYKGITASVDVNIGQPPVVLEDFENGLDKYLPSAGAQFNSTKVSIETNEDLVRFGNGSLKLEYDFTGKPGTSGAYLQTKSPAENIVIPGYPEKIGMWVYGDGKSHWLRAQLRDSKGTIPLDFTPQDIGVDWVGWKYVEADVPKGRTLPLTIDMPVRYMETSGAKKDAGVIYVDQIRALYGPNEDDLDPPILKNNSPAEGATVHKNQPTITVYGEDAGYDPVKNPGTTLIDPNSIRFDLDGVRVQHTLYPPEGKIYYTPTTPLADGIHQAKVSVCDLSGNRTTKAWTFNVDTGSSKLTYDTPKSLYAGNKYTVDIKGVKASDLKDGQLKLTFDPSKVENLSFIPGDKLNASQAQADIDSSTGTVTLTLNSLNTASLTDNDLIGQIQYDVKKDATGTNIIQFVSGSISFVSTGNVHYTFFGLPLSSEIKNNLSLAWNEDGNIQGYETVFQVKDESGAPVKGVDILADGNVIGTTDVEGKLKTGTLTSLVKTYKVQAVKGNLYSQVAGFKVSPLYGTETPYNINVSMGEDPSVSRGFTWHTNPGTEPTVVEYAKQAEFSGFDQPNVQKADGTSYLYQTLDLGAVRVHKATVNGLEPGATYVYRVGDGNGHYSQQGTFKTAGAVGEPTKFLYFADSQAGDLAGYKLWGNTVKKAIENTPDADFMVHVGDMVDKGYLEQEWNWWFSEAQDALMNTTLVSAIGNHEVMGTKENNDFLAHFNQPGNGLESLKGSNFSFDYGDIHFMVLNSEYQYEEQQQWLEQDLSNTTKKWKIAIFHRGPYGSIYDTEEIRRLWAPVLEKHQVDLVLNGHDHIYLRSYPMMNNQITEDGKGTTYVIAGSTGPKFYSLTKREWQRVTDDEATQMYASIEVDGDQLKYVTKTVGGRIVDEFTLTKQTVAPESVDIEEQDLQLAIGETRQLTAHVKPEQATDKRVTWSVYSSNPADQEVVTVSPEGLVTARGMGTAVVRATSTVNPDVYGETTITVNRVPEGLVDSISLKGKDTLKVGETDQTVTEAVYQDGTHVPLLDGVVYSSSQSDIASVNDQGTVTALSEGTTVISATYDSFHAEYVLNVQASDNQGGGEGNGGDQGNNGGGSGPVTPPVQPPVQPKPPENTGKWNVSASELSALLAKGEPVFSTDKPFEELTLPGNAASLLKDTPVTVKAGNVGVTIPTEVLRSLSELVPADQLEGSTMKLRAERMTGNEGKQWIANAESESGASLRAGSDLLKFSLSIITKDGKEYQLSELKKPLTLMLPVSSDVNRKLSGIYTLDSSGSLKFIGGAADNGNLKADIYSLQSPYAVLEYNKTFTDTAGHWASEVIQELAAKHLIEGVSSSQFAPDQKVTRAEMTAMLVRLLDLKGNGVTPFQDVSADKWYAEAISAAVQAGIVQGVSETSFAPDAVIKRQEAAAMIVRAYKAAGGQIGSDASKAVFKDVAASPAWVQEAVQSAYASGLMQGQSPERFNPVGAATRAESAQMIYNMLSKLK